MTPILVLYFLEKISIMKNCNKIFSHLSHIIITVRVIILDNNK